MRFFSFVGRKNELARFDKALNNNTLVLLLGKAGVGKTAFLTHFFNLHDEISVIRYTCKSNQSLADMLTKVSQLTSNKQLESFDTGSIEVYINQFMEIVESYNLIVILDSFENINDSHSKLFLSKIQRNLKASTIVVVTSRQPQIDPFEFIDICKIRLNLLSYSESTELCESFLDRSGLTNQIDYKYLHRKLNGHPLFIKYFYSLICNGRSSINELFQENSQVDIYINSYIFSEIWSKLSLNQKSILKVLSLLEVPIELSQLVFIMGENLHTDILSLIDQFLIEHVFSGELYLHNYLKSYIKKTDTSCEKVLHYKIARSFADKKTYFVRDLQQICFHYLQGNYIEDFSNTVLEITQYVLLSFIEMDDLGLVIDRNLYVNQGEFFEDLLEAKIKLLITKSNIPEALSLQEQIKDKDSLDRLQAFLFYHQGNYQDTIDLINSFRGSLSELSPLHTINLKLYMSVSLFRLNQKEQSKLYLDKALALAESNNFLKAAIYRYVSLGYLPLDLHLSLQYLTHAQEILEEQYPKSALYASVLFDQSTVEFKYLNNEVNALQYIEKCKRIYQELFLTQKYVQAALVEAGILIRVLQTGRATKIVNELRKNIMIDPFTSVKIDMLQGGISLLQQDLKGAALYFERGFDEVERLGIASRQFQLMFLRYLIASNQFERAYDFSNKQVFNSWFLGYPEDETEKYHYFIKIHRLLQKFDEIPSLQEKKNFHINSLSDFSKAKVKKSINWYQTNILNHTIPKYLMITNKNSTTISLDEVQEIKFKNIEWDLVIDFSDQKCFIKGNNVNLISKGKLFQLLKALALNNGREICSKDLYQKCWDTAYNPDIDGALKTNINRLRKLIKEYLDEPLILSPKRGVYSLHHEVNYCFIDRSTSESFLG